MNTSTQKPPTAANYQTTNTATAAFLATIGVPFNERKPMVAVETEPDKTQFVWQFADHHPDGTKTERLALAYEDNSLVLNDNENKLAYAAAGIDTYRHLVKATKTAHPLVSLRGPDGYIYTFPKGCKKHQALIAQGAEQIDPFTDSVGGTN